jgi:excisionase family DNA binding protein
VDLPDLPRAERVVARGLQEHPAAWLTFKPPHDRKEPFMSKPQFEAEELLTPAEVATMFRVDPKTVTRWAKAGKLSSIRTIGGHRRYKAAEVRALLSGSA